MKVSGSARRWWDLWRARRDGKRDGLRGVPTAGETALPPALEQLRRRGEERLATLWRAWEAEDAHLRETAEVAERQLELAHHEALVAARAADEARRWSHAARERLDAAEATLATPDPGGPRLSPRVYRVAIVAILVAEFPLNAVAFRLFGEAEVLTWVMTASLAVTLVLCAHGLGTFLRAANPTMAERRWIAVLIALPLATIVGIAVVRARYLSEIAEQTGLAALGPWMGSAVFLVINLLVYAGAAMLSYLAHGPRAASVTRETDAVEAAEDALRRAEERVAAAQADLQRHGDAAVRGPLAVDRALRVARARASEHRSYHAQLLAAYCTANLRARSAPEIPPILGALPEIEVPPALREPAQELAGLVGRNGHAQVEVRA
jgi:hypothetical protein